MNTHSPTPAEDLTDKTAWRSAMEHHLKKEKAHTQAADQLAAERRELPRLPIEKPYALQGADGPQTLLSLFQGRNQLVIYHFMFGTDWELGCPICSFWADSFERVDFHLNNRGTSFACVSTASIDKLHSYRDLMGWNFEWVSSAGTSFNADFGVGPSSPGKSWQYNFSTPTKAEEMPGLSVFSKDSKDQISLTYQTFARGLEALNATYQILDLTPAGRDETGLVPPMAWVERQLPTEKG